MRIETIRRAAGARSRALAKSRTALFFAPALLCSSCSSVHRLCRAAKLRRKALAKIQKSTARKLRLGRHETAMAEALLQVGALAVRGRGALLP